MEAEVWSNDYLQFLLLILLFWVKALPSVTVNLVVLSHTF
jgi:hypothetical protein